MINIVILIRNKQPNGQIWLSGKSVGHLKGYKQANTGSNPSVGVRFCRVTKGLNYKFLTPRKKRTSRTKYSCCRNCNKSVQHCFKSGNFQSITECLEEPMPVNLNLKQGILFLDPIHRPACAGNEKVGCYSTAGFSIFFFRTNGCTLLGAGRARSTSFHERELFKSTLLLKTVKIGLVTFWLPSKIIAMRSRLQLKTLTVLR